VAPPTERRCPNCDAVVRQQDRFCSSCGRGLPSASLQVSDSAAVSDAALAEQRKLVTVLFADLAASTPLGESQDPEDLRAVYERYFATLARQIRRYDGTIDKYVGDAVMAVFGAPVSHEDDAERAIRAGLAMQAAIASLNDDIERTHDLRLSMRIGIHTGEVVAGLLAGDVQHAYTVVGDAVNTADRYQKIAPHGEVVVSDSTRRLAQDAFVFEALPAVQMKGKAAAVIPYRVVRSRDEEIVPELGRMVDSASELARLRVALEQAFLGLGSAIDVTGEPGVGKSRLVLEVRRGLAQGVQRQVVRCASYQSDTAYVVFADIVRGVFAISATDTASVARDKLVEWCSRLDVYLSPEILTVLLGMLGYGEYGERGERATFAPELVRQLVTATVRDLLRASSRVAPVVIVIEDVQWMDRSSAQLVADLVPDIDKLAVLLVTTSRTGTHLAWPAVRIELAPLADADARALARDLGGDGVPKDLVERLLERTGGNPFFIEEVLREMREGGRTDVPATVHEVIEAHLDRLAPGPLQVLKIAAVIGRSFWLTLLKQLVPAGSLSDDLALLEQEGFIVRRTIRPELAYAFRQPLLQEVAYQVQLQATRRASHARVAEAIESLYADRLDEYTDLLAYHWARSEDRQKALEWLVRSGERAQSLYANEEALAAYNDALSRAEDGMGRGGAGWILERIADVELLVGRYDDAIAACVAARERAATADHAVHARLLRKIGTAHRWKGDYEPALQSFREASAMLGSEADPEAAHIALAEAMAHFHRGEYATARTALERGLDLGTRFGVGDDVQAEGLKILGNVLNNIGEIREATAAYRKSLEIYERRGDKIGIASLHNNLGNMFRRGGHYTEALEEHRRALDLRERVGHRWEMATSHNNIGEVYRSMGRSADAIPELEQAFEIWDSLRAKAGSGLALMNLGAARLESGDAAGGREDLRAALGRLERTKFLPGAHRDLARAELALGDLPAAQSHADIALDLAIKAKARQTAAQAQRVLAEIALARHDAARAQELLEQSRQTFIELGETTELARTDEVLARVSVS
jgi:adenylate cyclase